MSKIQGKQIEDSTIEQKHLLLGNPTSGDTTSGATVGYVNSLSGSTVIGAAEDGSYTDGIFTDFNESTRIGVAIDRFNEVLLKLAPTPPSDWGTATYNITSTTFSARSLSTGSNVSTITSVNTPIFTVTIPINGLSDATNGILTFDIDNSIQEIYNVTGSTNKTTGVIRYVTGDPYSGQSGKSNFWTGFTSASTVSSIITPSSSLKTSHYIHSTKGTLTKTFYLDNPLTVTIGTITASVPTMTRYISGVPSLSTGDSITSISFNITNVSSYFYASTSVWQINTGLVATQSGDPDTIPTSNGETGTVTNKTTTVLTNQFNDTNFIFTVRGRNAAGTYGSNTTFTDNTKRVDTVSNETSRLTSSSGSYPSTGWGGTFDSTQSLVGTYASEMMLKNGIYQYPNGNYTTYGGSDYTSATDTRWATFNIGTFTNNSAFSLTINGATNITSVGQSNLLIEVKISGTTSWVNADAYYSGVGNPGSGADGVSAVDGGYVGSSATYRRITFGSVTYTGSIIVRIGITGSGPTFTSISASSII